MASPPSAVGTSPTPLAESSTLVSRPLSYTDRLQSTIGKQIRSVVGARPDFSITLPFPLSPVVLGCGHIFDKAVTQQFVDNRCTVCQIPVSQSIAIQGLQVFIASLLSAGPVAMLPDPKMTRANPDPEIAAQLFAMAGQHAKKEDYETALAFAQQALRYTGSSKDYAYLPGLYDKLQDPAKALLSRLYLGLYQLREEKVEAAVATLQLCEPSVPDLTSLIADLLSSQDTTKGP